MDRFNINRKNYTFALLFLSCAALSGYACNPSPESQDKQSGVIRTTGGIRTATLQMPGADERANFALGKGKPACCKGAPSRSRLTARLKKAP